MEKPKLPDFEESHYPFPPKGNNYVAQMDRAYNLLIGAEKTGILDIPVKPMTPEIKPGEKASAIETIPEIKALNPVRYKVMAEQLWLLGYLKNKLKYRTTANIQSKPAFKNAVKRFQSEAELTVDNWIGDQTWRALNAMVGFESNTKIDRWVRSDGMYNRAFRRAVQLRLWTYGLAEKKPGLKFNSIPYQNIERLKKVLWSLELIKDYRAEISRNKLFTILFNSDLLVAAAAEFKPRVKPENEVHDSFDDELLKNTLHKKILVNKRRFLSNLAKVELWLLGSDIKIDGKDDYPVAGLGSKKIRKRIIGPRPKHIIEKVVDKKVRKYLKQYWLELAGLNKKMASRKARFITPSLFKSLQNPETVNQGKLSTFDEIDYSRQIAVEFEKAHNTEDLIAKSYVESKKLGMNLWDGLKRLWAWVKKGVKKIVSFAKNISRAFYRFAMKGFIIVRTAFSAFARSLDQYFSGQIDINSRHKVMVQIKKEMDTRIFISDKSKNSDIMEACRSVKQFGAMFFFSCKIISLFIDILQSAATGLLGWARLIMSHVKGYRELVPAYYQLTKVM